MSGNKNIKHENLTFSENDENLEKQAMYTKIQELERDLIIAQISAKRAQKNLYKAHQDLKARERAIEEIRNSLSFKIGWAITAPLRWVYDKIYGAAPLTRELPASPDEGTVISEQHLFSILPEVQEYDLEKRIEFEQQRNSFFRNRAESKKEKVYRPNLLFSVPNLPAYDLSSGDKRLFRLLSLLSENCDVYIYTQGEKKNKYIKALEEQNIRVYQGKGPNELRTMIPFLDALIFCWYYTLFDCFELTKLFPEAKVVIDTVDVHWLREFRSLEAGNILQQEAAEKNKEQEILAYKAADLIWAVTENDRTEIQSEIPGSQVEIVSNIHEVNKHPYVQTDKHTVLFFGGYQHQPNLAAVKILAEEIFPEIHRKVPDAQLLIVGSKAPPEVKELGKRPGIEYLGFVEEEAIPEIYHQSQITIIPLLAGAGIKGKICEAIAYGTPVITNDIGNEGIGLEHLKDGVITNSTEEMAEYAIKAFKGELSLEAMATSARNRLQKLVAPEIVKAKAIDSIFPMISICIVTWNRKELLEKCINSILEHTHYPHYKIQVHSNGCTDGTQAYLKDLAKKEKRIDPILSDKNDVFVLPNNQMMERYPTADIVLLNNDVVVSPGWLMGLHRAAYLSDKIGISGSKILYPDGTLQEFGSELYADGTGRNIGKYEDPDLPEFNQLTLCGYVSGCALFIKRSTIEKIGTFDEQFHPCYCEDSDYCYTAKEQGLATVVTPESIIYHYEGATSGTDTESGFKAYQKANMQKFLEKHRGKPNGIDWTGHN